MAGVSRKVEQVPWASGPGEILRHGLDLLRKDTDTNRRLAMISIDNSVELMIKTYLGLPKRISGLTIPRKEYQEIAESFPALLDALEKYAGDKLDGIDLGAIEWYHRIRNELYHQGNGLTVERDKVEVYSELANVLFKNLFGVELLDEHRSAKAEMVGEFMAAWAELERGLRDLASTHSLLGVAPTGMLDLLRFIDGAGLLNSHQMAELNSLRRIRNNVAHAANDWEVTLTPDVVERVKHYAGMFAEASRAG